ncbi:nitroreductase family protein [Aneurinibacillus sp. REN35]|uniref:nitroreductase family protein n=1 Tax=Aneurinibacillus sp. REN35 TaxID=3237286 RepID=UPI00352791DE
MSVEAKSLQDAIKERRSIRKVKKNERITKDKIENILKLSLHAPSAFNMQSGRMTVLLENHHEEFWDIVKETLRPNIAAEDFKPTEDKLQGFREGVGTILFFENQETVRHLEQQAPLYKQHFANWSEQGSGILQYAVWLSFAAEGIGASLQHYNPLIDEEVKRKWDIPNDWSLVAQMPFGEPDEQPGERSFLPFDDIVKWHD